MQLSSIFCHVVQYLFHLFNDFLMMNTPMNSSRSNRPTTASMCIAPVMQTPYMVMVLEANEVPARINLLASLYLWLTLAGFVVFPGTFSSLQNSSKLVNSEGGKFVQHTVENAPLLPLAFICCFIGIVGSCCLWWERRKNYIWAIAHVFL